ncbi:MAG TPA: energy transducer TonB [Steroidobacteraceae bacterium]|jgi:TonB family protein|nr:energy transducer TonB [Steroidobacteraceae bacterium]
MNQRNVQSVPAGWMDGLGQRLIRHAARRAPESLSQRLQEEWLADWTVRTSAMSRLRFALGCCWATRVIALEFQPSGVLVASPAVAGKWVSVLSQHGAGYFSRRSGTLFIVTSLHALLFYGLITTVTHIHVSATDPLQNRPLTHPDPQTLPIPVAKPSLTHVAIHVPPIDQELWRETDQGTGVTIISEPPPLIPPSPPQPVKQVLGGPGAGFPNTDDFYPPQSRRLDEQGIGTVQVCVDANGRLTADPRMLQGTGSARLDDGALKLARAGSGHYRATTENGRPVNSCYAFRVRFQLTP